MEQHGITMKEDVVGDFLKMSLSYVSSLKPKPKNEMEAPFDKLKRTLVD